MKKICLFFGMLICSLILISCNSETNEQIINEKEVIGNPTPEDILTNNTNADIFKLDGIVYKNAEEIDWVKKLKLTIGKKLGEIKKNTNTSREFENYTATKLPIGAVIYKTVEKKGPILIVVVDNKEIRYLGLIEG